MRDFNYWKPNCDSAKADDATKERGQEYSELSYFILSIGGQFLRQHAGNQSGRDLQQTLRACPSRPIRRQ